MAFDLLGFSFDFLAYYGVYLAISLSLNVEFGFAGIPNFGKVLFVAGGAALAGSVTGRLAAWVLGVGNGQDFITANYSIIGQVNTDLLGNPLFTISLVVIGLLLAAAIGGFLGWVMTYPAIHLREDYLGLLLLGMAQFFDIFLRTWTPLVGGTQSILTVNPFYWFSTLPINDLTSIAQGLTMLAFAVLVYLYVERVAKSPLGRVLRAMRDNDDASSALGKDTAKLRRNALVISSAIAGMAGAMWTFYTASVGADTWTRFAWTFWPFLIVIMGGAANNKGVALGTFFFILIFKGLQQAQPLYAPFIPISASYFQDFLFAGLLLVILYLRPEGIIRERSSPTLTKEELDKISGRGSGGVAPAGTAAVSKAWGRARRLLAKFDGPSTVV